MLAIGAYLATTGQISVGTFVTFESAFWEISYNIAHLMHFIPVAIQAAAATRHMQEMLDEPARGQIVPARRICRASPTTSPSIASASPMKAPKSR